MTQNVLSNTELLGKLGIDRNLAYKISGGIDNLETLFYVIEEILEDLQRECERVNTTPYILQTVNRIIQLSYIVDNEMRLLKQNSDKLLEQIESSN